MAIAIPVVCSNPKCALVYFVRLEFQLKRMTVEPGASSNPCPRCTAVGKILPGEYVQVKAGLLYTASIDSELELFDRALQMLRLELAKDADPTSLKENAIEHVPELRSLWDLIPQTRKEAYAFLAIIMTILLFISNQLRHVPNDQWNDSDEQVILVPYPVYNALPPREPDSRDRSSKSARPRSSEA